MINQLIKCCYFHNFPPMIHLLQPQQHVGHCCSCESCQLWDLQPCELPTCWCRGSCTNKKVWLDLMLDPMITPAMHMWHGRDCVDHISDLIMPLPEHWEALKVITLIILSFHKEPNCTHSNCTNIQFPYGILSV